MFQKQAMYVRHEKPMSMRFHFTTTHDLTGFFAFVQSINAHRRHGIVITLVLKPTHPI